MSKGASDARQGDVVVVVSGLPRSGTSMMMGMLAAGGLPLRVDDDRRPDASNPVGYYEFAPVKGIARDATWMPRAVGHAIKIVSPLLRHCPADQNYEIIFMRRPLVEIMASQQRMLVASGDPGATDDASALLSAYERHLGQVEAWVNQSPNVRLLDVNFADAVANPLTVARRVSAFLSLPCDPTAMVGVVDPTLYHGGQ